MTLPTISGKLASSMLGRLGAPGDDQIKGWLDTTYPPLNKLLTGDPTRGIPYGRITEIYGPSGSGKSWLATQLMIQCQQSGGIPILMDHEYAFNMEYARKQGLVAEEPFFFKREPDTLEDSVDAACDIVKMIRDSRELPDTAPILVVFDSIHAMVPKVKLEKDKTSDLTMHDRLALAASLSNVVPVVNQRAAKQNAMFVFLNQIRTKPGVMYGDPTTTPGGNTMEFYASIRLALGRRVIKEGTGDEKEAVGQMIGITTKKNRFNAPFQECDVMLRFDDERGSEFDRVSSLIGVLIAEGKLTYSKPRVTWIDGKQYFAKQLAEKVRNENLYPELVKLYNGA